MQLSLFIIAAMAIIGCGLIVNSKVEITAILILLLCAINGVLFVYGVIPNFGEVTSLKRAFFNFFQTPFRRIITLQFIFITCPLAFYYFDKLTLIVLMLVGVGGLLYSLNFKPATKVFRLKNIVFVKNLLIGVFWGALVLIGSGMPENNTVYALFVLVSLQVFVGSMIRDIPDIAIDRLQGVNSFPIVFGVNRTFILMHSINFLTVVIAILADWSDFMLTVTAVTFVWRTINLLVYSKKQTSVFWGQTINLLTCVVIFILVILVPGYDLF